MTLEAAIKRVEIEVEINVLQENLKRLKRRSSLRAVYERQIKEARLALMMIDLNWNDRRAA